MYLPRIELEPTIFINGPLMWIGVAGLLALVFWLTRRRPDYGLGLVVAALPFYQVRGHLGLPFDLLGSVNIPTTLLELLLAVVLLGIVSCWPAYRPPRTRYDGWLALWVGGALLAAAVGPDIREGFGLWRAFFLEPTLFFYAALAVFRKHDLRALLWGVLGAITLLAVWSIWLTLDGRAITYDRRLLGPFQSPNYLALLLGPLLLFILTWPQRVLQYPRVVVGLLGLSMLLATGSRGGQLAFLAALLVGTIFLGRRLRRLVLVGLATLLVVGAIVIGPSLLSHTEDQVVSARPVVWGQAVQIIADQPLFGNGPGQFQDVFRERTRDNQTYQLYVLPQALNSHNTFLTTWTEWGLLTLLGFIGLLVTFIRVVRARLSYWQIGPVTMMMAILIHGLVDTSVLKNDLVLLFGLVLALSLLVPKAKTQRLG